METLIVTPLDILAVVELQFGHGFGAVETAVDALEKLIDANPASIRPRIWGRGNPTPTQRSGRGRRRLQFGHGFGAVETAVATRVIVAVEHGFNSATDLGPWKPWIGGRNQRIRTSFNSATDLGPWKPIGWPNLETLTVSGFNSATDLGPWKPAGIAVLIGLNANRFNSATDLGPWKPPAH